MKKEYLILEAVNEIIKEAIIHGGDAGGPYLSNEEGLEKAMDGLLALMPHDIKAGVQSSIDDFPVFYIE